MGQASSKSILESSAAFKVHLTDLLKFHHKEIDGFKSISKNVDDHHIEFSKMMGILKSKKDRLWRASVKEDFDYTTWYLSDEDYRHLHDFKGDEIEAKRRMLNYETFKCRLKSNLVKYLQNESIKEIRRIGMNVWAQFREKFLFIADENA